MSLANEQAKVMNNAHLGVGLWLMELESPIIAREILPGQFVHMKVPGMDDHILRRPFSIYSRNASDGTVEILYQVVGFGTDHMTSLCAGDVCEMIGPVGHGWQVPEGARKVLLVGGGVGAAPLFMLCDELVERGIKTDVVLGASTSDALVCRPKYETLECGCVKCATDDGTYGREGFCTSLVEEALQESEAEGSQYDYLAVCGPEPLMKIVAEMATSKGIQCEVSLEKRMACGIGACLSCVVDTVNGKKRSCVDGPIFKASEVVW